MSKLIKRDFFIGPSDEAKRLYYDRPFKEWIKLTILLLKLFLFKYCRPAYSVFSKDKINKKRIYARKVPDKLTKTYLSGKPFFELQTGNQTRPAVILSPDENFSFQKKIEAQDTFFFGICPMSDEYFPSRIKKWSFTLRITKLDTNTADEYKATLPYNGRTDCFAYFPGDGWVDSYINLDDYTGSTCLIEIEPEIITKSAEEKKTTSITISCPQIVTTKPLDQVKNVLLISVESLTDLNFLKNKYSAVTFPTLDRLASENVSYPRVYSPTDSTLSFAASMLTGLLPSQHAIGNYGIAANSFDNNIYNESLKSLPEFFKENGFLTFYGGTQVRFSSKVGWARGFDSYFHIFEKWKPNVPGIDWLTRLFLELPYQDKFVYTHIDFLHDPLVSFNDSDRPQIHDLKLLNSTQSDNMEQLYFNQLRRLDQKLGQFIQTLKQSNLYENTAIILTGDHGCGINWVKHAENALYEERIRVPLIVKYPQWSQNQLPVKKISNSVSEIYKIAHGLLNKELPEYISKLAQYHSSAGNFAFSETIMNPNRDYKRHNLAMMSEEYKYICWNHIDWDNCVISERIKDCLYKWDANLNSFNENQNLAEINKEELKKHNELAYEVINNNLKFLSLYPPKRY